MFDVKPIMTRKLRRRPNDPMPLPAEKRRKTSPDILDLKLCDLLNSVCVCVLRVLTKLLCVWCVCCVCYVCVCVSGLCGCYIFLFAFSSWLCRVQLTKNWKRQYSFYFLHCTRIVHFNLITVYKVSVCNILIKQAKDFFFFQ